MLSIIQLYEHTWWLNSLSQVSANEHEIARKQVKRQLSNTTEYKNVQAKNT